MPDNTEYIDSYFHQTLSSEERRAFESKCETEPAFANEVAIYIATRETLREMLLQQKANAWKTNEAEQEEDETPIIPLLRKRPTFGRWVMYAAAACLILFLSVFLFERITSPKVLASNFITKDYTSLSHEMSATEDNMQLGISAYNDKDYAKAAQLFEGITKTDPDNSEAKKYAGLSYYQSKNYDKAIAQFDALANMKSLFSNSGDYLKAVALLQRNKPGDKEHARELLIKVKDLNEGNTSEADELLKKF